MQPQRPECLPADLVVSLACEELARSIGLSERELAELVEYGALPAGALLFDPASQAALRQALRLRADFDLDLFTAALLARYLRRISELEEKVRVLQAHLPHAVSHLREGPARWHEPHG